MVQICASVLSWRGYHPLWSVVGSENGSHYSWWKCSRFSITFWELCANAMVTSQPEPLFFNMLWAMCFIRTHKHAGMHPPTHNSPSLQLWLIMRPSCCLWLQHVGPPLILAALLPSIRPLHPYGCSSSMHTPPPSNMPRSDRTIDYM